MRITSLVLLISLFSSIGIAQSQKGNQDAFFLKEIYNAALTSGQDYDWLEYLSELKWWMFALPVLLAILIAGITIGMQAARAALNDPVDALARE